MKTLSLNLPRDKGALSIKATTVMFASLAIYFHDITIVANEVFS